MSTYYCAHCGQRSSQQGHYMSVKAVAGYAKPCPNVVERDGFAFCCPEGHTCKTKEVPAK